MNASKAVPLDLQTLQGTSRVLLIFAPSAQSPAYQSQMTLLKGQEEAFRRRDLVLVQVLYEGDSHFQDQRLDEASEAELRARFGVEGKDFLIVLLDKEGTEQRRDTAPLQPAALFDEAGGLSEAQEDARRT